MVAELCHSQQTHPSKPLLHHRHQQRSGEWICLTLSMHKTLMPAAAPIPPHLTKRMA